MGEERGRVDAEAAQAEELNVPAGHPALVQEGHQEGSFFSTVWEEFKEPGAIIFGHAVLMVFGLIILSLLAWIIDISHLSETAKHVAHIIDEYLMIFAFVVFGFSFIIKIATVVLGGGRK